MNKNLETRIGTELPGAKASAILERDPGVVSPSLGMNKNPDARIRTELPGPKARALLARDAEVTSPSYPRDYPFVMSHGRGAEVWDVDGNRFLDFAAGIAVCSTGHSHPL